MKKAVECYLKDLYARAGLEKDKEQSMADKKVICAEINMRNKSQWQAGRARSRTWPLQGNQGNRSNSGYSRSYDMHDCEDNTENKMYRNNTGSSRDTEVKEIDMKQHKFSENLQCSQPAVVARGGYTQIVVNPMQLEDEAFTAWMQRLTEARRNRENRVQRP